MSDKLQDLESELEKLVNRSYGRFNELVGEDDEPIRITIHKINFGEANPNRINFFLDMDPDWSNGSFTNKINSDISRFFRMLGVDKNLHIYWNKRPLF
jgi:hypothetical protein